MIRRVVTVAVLATATVTVLADPAAAHGVGSRADLPLPVWLFAYSAAFALLISFAALRLLWPRPRLAAASRGRSLPAGVGTAAQILRAQLQVLVTALFLTTFVAGWLGTDSVAENLAPTALFIAFWVGMQVISALVGDVWHHVNPLWIAGAAVDRLRGRDPSESTATGWWATHWPAAAGLFAFQWLELAFFDPGGPRNVAIFITLYAGFVLAGSGRFGAGWVRTGDGFAVLFSLLGALSPMYRDAAGTLRLRAPGAGLATIEVRSGTLAVILVVLGGTTFDGVTRTTTWSDLVGTRRGWALTQVHTLGLLVTIVAVALVFLLAVRLVGVFADDDAETTTLADRWAPSLVPIVLAYSLAHYYSLLIFEGQSFLALLSDPLGQGWDLFGTAGNAIDYTIASPEHIAYVQTAAIVIGHVTGVIMAHDRAVERYDHRRAVRSQYPLLAVMVAYTVTGLLLLLNA